MSTTIERAGKTYWLHVYRGGVHQRINTGATTRRDALRSADRINALFDREKQTKMLTAKLCEYAYALAEKQLRRDMLISPLRGLQALAALEVLPIIGELFPAPPVTAAELWSRYIASRPEVKPVTLRAREGHWRKFSHWAGERDLSDFQLADARRFLASLHASGQTIRNYISDLSVVFEAAAVPNVWKNQTLRPKNVEHAEAVPMDFAAAKTLLAFCDDHPAELIYNITLDRWAAFLRALYYSGQRPVDVCHFEYKEFDGQVIDLIPEKTSRTRRHVNYRADPRLRQLLGSLPRDDARFFFPEFAEMYDRDRGTPSKAFAKLAARAGIDPKYTLYSFRHGFITYQLDAGTADADVAAAVGHTATATTTGHYYHGKKTVALTDLPEL